MSAPEACPNLRQLGRELLALYDAKGGTVRVEPNDLPGGSPLVIRAFADVCGKTPSAQAESEALTAAGYLISIATAIYLKPNRLETGGEA